MNVTCASECDNRVKNIVPQTPTASSHFKLFIMFFHVECGLNGKINAIPPIEGSHLSKTTALTLIRTK